MDRFNNLTLRIKILSVAAVILFLLIGIASLVYSGIQASQEREDLVTHTYQVIGMSDEMLLQLVNMQTGQRGFLLSGQESFLEPYADGEQAYNDIKNQLNQLISNNLPQLERLRKIESRVEQWNEEINTPVIALRREVTAGKASQQDVIDFVASGTGKRQFDEIRDEIRGFRQVEEQLLADRSRESEAAAAWLKSILLGGTALALFLGMGTSLLIATTISRRVNLVAQAATGMALGRLDQRYELPSGRDEIGTMATAFSHMADTIRSQIEAQQRVNEELRAASEAKVAREYIEEVVGRYSSFASEVARGNLAVRLQISDNQDELSALGRNLNMMVESLHVITNQVQQANANIAAAAAEILAATTQQAASAAEQSAAITQTSTTVEEVKAIAQQTAQQAQQVARESQMALDVARQGTLAVEETVGGMSRIREKVETIAQTILSLAEQTQAIGAITATVTDLADQSNLLALNAAIEAARAGEQGKSFAVVAQHVRELAERSKQATAQVGEILGEIQRSTNAAVLVTEEGSKGVDTGSRMASEAGQVIHRIATEVEHGAQANVQMAAAAQQQTMGMEQIGQAMTNIQQATTQALASTRQAERAAQDLHELARSLQQTVASYRL